MLIQRVLLRGKGSLALTLRRNFGVVAPLAQKVSDPIQKLFVDKIRDYRKKSESSGGKLVDPNPDIEREMKTEMDRIAKIYGGGQGVDMTKFPTFNFPEPAVDPISQ